MVFFNYSGVKRAVNSTRLFVGSVALVTVALFGALMVQDNGGRIEPIDTLAREVLRKVTRKESRFGLDADQIFLGMIIRPKEWQKVPMIKVSHPGVNELLGIDPKAKYAAFDDFFDFKRKESYKLGARYKSYPTGVSR
jgi:hypothetical protein